MKKLTAGEVRELSKAFRDLAIEVGNYLDRNWNDIPRARGRKLEQLQDTLTNQAQVLNVLALELRLDEAEASLANIQKATREAKKAVKRLNDVGKGVKILTAAVQLTGAVVSRDLKAIAKGAKELIDVSTA